MQREHLFESEVIYFALGECSMAETLIGTRKKRRRKKVLKLSCLLKTAVTRDRTIDLRFFTLGILKTANEMMPHSKINPE